MTDPADRLITDLFSTTSTVLVDLEPRTDPDAPERLLVLTNTSGSMQLAELVDAEVRPLTALPEPVADAQYVPGSRQAVIAVAAGGNERDQLHLVDLDAAIAAPATSFADLEVLTDDPAHIHRLAGISADGRLVAYISTKANGVDLDPWILDLATGEHRLLWAGGAYCGAAGGFSPDGRYLAVTRAGRLPLDEELVLIDVATGEPHWPLPHPDEAALVGVPVWLDAYRFEVSSNIGRDFSAIVRHDLATGETETLPGTGGDAEAITTVRAAGAGTSVLVEIRDAATPMWLLTTPAGAPAGPRAELPQPEPGVVTNFAIPSPRLSADGRHLYYSMATPRASTQVHRLDLETETTAALTSDASGLAPDTLVRPELHTITSFDGEPIQLTLFRPPTTEPTPAVVVLLHGGPESQAQWRFDPIPQALAAAGFAVVVPNVRGSTGYGKRFAALDDTVKRLDSVQDLTAIHGALAGLGLDPARAALWGQSYGGYMVLAGVSMQPDLWAAGVDIVGIANLVTYLENTSPYRRAVREAEYGSLEHDRDFLVRASPLSYVDQIRAPLFVIHGRNDPRVPVSESEALHAHLSARGVTCELLIYENEGHGLFRTENRLEAFPRAIRFLQRTL